MAKVFTVTSKVNDENNFVEDDDFPIYGSNIEHSDFDDEEDLIDDDGTLISDEEEDNESGFLSQR